MGEVLQWYRMISIVVFEPSLAVYPFILPFFLPSPPLHLVIMVHASTQNSQLPRANSWAPQPSKPIKVLGYELNPSFTDLVREQNFSSFDSKNFNNLQKFEKMCLCLNIKAWHKKHFGGSCFLSHLRKERSNGIAFSPLHRMASQ